MTARPILEIGALTYRYPQSDRPALVGVDLVIEEGEFVVLCGASGSGKSTLLRAASGLVPHFHGGELAGEVVVAGMSTRTSRPAKLAAEVGSLFQDPESQIVMDSVDRELALGLEQQGAAPATIARAVEEVALALGASHLAGRSTAQLSGGELQRVALGAVLAPGPRLALLDEPTSQLDPVAGDELIGLLRRLNEQHGLTIVLGEHRLERCLSAADRVVALDRGRIVQDCDPVRFVEWAVEQAKHLATPAARMFSLAGMEGIPVGVKEARAALNAAGFELRAGTDRDGADGGSATQPATRNRSSRPRRRRGNIPAAAVEFKGAWHEIDDGSAAGRPLLRGVDLRIEAGERVALLGRNGAGKSTLLRHLNGLARPTRGRILVDGVDARTVAQAELAARAALLMQCPADYFLSERVRDELPADSADRALEAARLTDRANAHPHDLSGGERQRLALAIVMAGRGWPDGDAPAVVALDEPTRGMDRHDKQLLVEMLRHVGDAGSAVIVATHDVELAAALATRAVVLGEGRPIADGAPRDVLAGGWYFATEVGRVLGACHGATLPEEGALLIRGARAGVTA